MVDDGVLGVANVDNMLNFIEELLTRVDVADKQLLFLSNVVKLRLMRSR